MNRDAGVTEERLEVFSSNEKRVVTSLTETVIYKDNSEIKPLRDPWQPMLKARGFEDIIDDFLQLKPASYGDILTTHEVCENIVTKLREPETTNPRSTS
jgi:virulence factor